MGYQSQYIDLRVLFVQPEDTGQSLQQVAMDEFEFDRIAHATDQQNALDQLCFSNFDLMILSDSLSSEAVEELITSCQATAHEPALPILVLADAKSFLQTTSEQQPIWFCPPQSNLQQLSDDLGRVFRQTQALRDKGPTQHSRALHSTEQHATR